MTSESLSSPPPKIGRKLFRITDSVWLRQWSPFLIFLLSFAVFMLLFFTVVLKELPIADSNCLENGRDKCWCERIHDGLIKQPWNTWTNLGFVVAGFYCLFLVCYLDRDPGGIRTAINPMTGGGFYPICFGGLLIGMGVGSMMFHGPMMHWGGFSDFVMVMAFAVFIALYNLSRLWPRLRPISTFSVIFLTVVIVMSIVYVKMPIRSLGFYLFSIGGAVIFEVLTWLSWTHVTRDPTGAAVFLGLFAAALVIWDLSRTGGPLCNPDGFQGHGVWHMMVSLSIPFFFHSLRSEIRKDAWMADLEEEYPYEVEMAAPPQLPPPV